MSNATQGRPRAAALLEGERVIERGITGTVRWYSTQRGYGRILADDQRDIYVHYSGLETPGFAPLTEGQAVTFDIADGKRGLKCINVTTG
jgi:CspA family cold shock protein